LIGATGRIGIGLDFLIKLENRLASFKKLLDEAANRCPLGPDPWRAGEIIILIYLIYILSFKAMIICLYMKFYSFVWYKARIWALGEVVVSLWQSAGWLVFCGMAGQANQNLKLESA
jgi:hypothetical protein